MVGGFVQVPEIPVPAKSFPPGLPSNSRRSAQSFAAGIHTHQNRLGNTGWPSLLLAFPIERVLQKIGYGRLYPPPAAWTGDLGSGIGAEYQDERICV